MSASKSEQERIVALSQRRQRSARIGRVSIVGAGPGDPELLTVRALRRLENADVLVHDRLVDPAILDHARADARRIYVGKRRGCHAMDQIQINALLVDLAREGFDVVRLKGGDPFVFGRGGEELLHLRAHGIDAEVVPGVTAALGCAASAGVPVTHRDLAQAVTFVTGHAKDGAEPDLDWASLARVNHTLVVYMGVATAGRVAARLIENGLDGATPIAIVENGTRKNERVLTGHLAGLGALVDESDITGPAVLVIGRVAAFADRDDIASLAAAAGSAA
ncbi:MAG: uroporphyrinogen-III C-methyltransferase [Rhodospirillaceae bacterium]|nr:uroporphyrinogen-III C-methyltransferase [Rhodospirillaceae bacterium]